MADTQVIRKLNKPTWRNLLLPPFKSLGFHLEHDVPEKALPYVNIPVHDYTGLRPKPFDVELHFLNSFTSDVLSAYGGELFPSYWERFRNQILDGEPGDFDHPLLGLIRCRCKMLSSKGIDSEVTSGIVVRVQWVQTNEDPSVTQLYESVTVNPAALAAAADAAASLLGVLPAPGRLLTMSEAIFGTTFPTGLSLAGEWARVAGGLFSLDVTVSRMLSVLIGDVDGMIDAITALDDVAGWQALDSCISLRNYASTAAESLAQANRPTKARVISRATTLDAFASAVGNTLDEVIGLNLPALGRPDVPAGTSLRYYATS